ncbi:MAG: heme ABC exporter ATP-binding protein CcmA, partial [Qipengyuania sp.]
FARLLNASQAIWLLDEPLNGLDGNARLKVEEQMGLHCAKGGICIVASHQPIALPAISGTIVLEAYAP